MPNWCQNRVKITGPNDVLDALFFQMQTHHKFLSYMMPEELNLSWGTKWEISEDELTENFERSEGEIRGNFESAWDPPNEAFQYFADQNPGVRIQNYYHEPDCGLHGLYDTKTGDKEFDFD